VISVISWYLFTSQSHLNGRDGLDSFSVGTKIMTEKPQNPILKKKKKSKKSDKEIANFVDFNPNYLSLM
jgi:type II restriction/modification system DNA methylase subunit YeeA